MSGEAAEALGRKWIAVESEMDYVIGSAFRFMQDWPDDDVAKFEFQASSSGSSTSPFSFVVKIARIVASISQNRWFEPTATTTVGGRKMARQKPVRKTAKAVGKSEKPTATETVFQFKITLRDSKPPIWRRIQLRDCTLDTLHEHIQTSMGWTNSHLHHFRISEQFYGAPTLLEETMDEMGYEDSTTTMLSHVVPTSREGFRFRYEYDFGDSWEHEVLFEGCVEAEPGRKYPVCVAGKRACPPEDIGGVWGYADFLEAIGSKKHPQHDEMLEWVGDDFDPDEFDPAIATKCMHGGLPDWS